MDKITALVLVSIREGMEAAKNGQEHNTCPYEAGNDEEEGWYLGFTAYHVLSLYEQVKNGTV